MYLLFFGAVRYDFQAGNISITRAHPLTIAQVMDIARLKIIKSNCLSHTHIAFLFGTI